MVKTKLSHKRKTSSQSTKSLRIEDFKGLEPYNPLDNLLNPDFVGKAIFECLSNNDPEGVVEIIASYLELLNKTQMAKSVNLPRSTLYNALKGKNPTIKTLSKMVYAGTHPR